MQRNSVVKNVLNDLCCSYGWSYGVLWSFDQSNSLLLTMRDAYYEEKLEGLIENLPIQVPTLGGGLIAQAAFTKKHQWMATEDHNRMQDSSNSICDMFVDDSEFDYQFSSGIKTIAAIPLVSQGVVQFGSTEKIMETEEFVYQTKKMFQEIGYDSVLENAPCPSSSNSQNYPPNEFLASSVSSKQGYFGSFAGDDHNSVEVPICSSAFPTQPSFFSSNSQPMILPNNPESRTLESWNPIPAEFWNPISTHSNSSLPLTNNHQDLFDSLPEFGILQTNDFDISQWIPTSPQQELIPMNFEEKGGILMHLGTDFTSTNTNTTLGPRKGLLSKLGIGELLEGLSGTSNATMTEEKMSSVAKRRKTGNSLWDINSLQSVLNSSLNGMPKSEPSFYNTNCLRPQKATKKKAKPGTRPRPKDRQQILDRMAELRELIPNGDKMSIDCLLDRTIKHMIFLESITKHADRIKQADEPKNKIDNDPRSNGVTWACELANQTMVCPLIVEDLGTPGQMLIEMLCEENGFFLEMVDVIRGFGVTILKGVMEARDKIWARFIVETEAKRHVSRHEIFSALVQLLEVACINDNQLHNKTMESGNFLLDNVYCIDL